MSTAQALRGLAADVADIPRDAMITTAKAAKKIVETEGRRYAGADGLKGKKKRGLKLRARDDIRNAGGETQCRIQGSVPGWIWINSGTAPHAIRRRKKRPTGRTKRGQRRFDMRKMTVRHPGTRGRHVWAGIADEVAEMVTDTYLEAVAKAVRDA